jgi:anion-transporting  ArsA/GET3 family ATPase
LMELAGELRLVAASTGSAAVATGPASAKTPSFRDKGSNTRVGSIDQTSIRGEAQLHNPIGPALRPVAQQTGMQRIGEQRTGRQRRTNFSKHAEPLSDGVGTALVDRRVVLVCGPGGVGKTTTAAALGLAYAMQGQRVAVVTIDPAKRLANALGIVDGLRNTPSRVELRAIPAGPISELDAGELWALMLDTKATFDGLVRQYAPNTVQAEKILDNPFYRNISGAMGGTQEYMATEKLYELLSAPINREGRAIPPFDVVIVDTPPSRHALDFVAAPERLTRLLDNRVFRTLMAPAKRGFRVMGLATEGVLRGVGKVIGGEVLADAVAFFQAFEGMEAGFRGRAVAIGSLLRADSTAWVLVSAPTPEAVEEGLLLKTALSESSITLAAIVANRVQPEVPDWPFLTVDAQPPRRDLPEPNTQISTALREARLRFSQHQRALAPLLATTLTDARKGAETKHSTRRNATVIPHVLIPQRSIDVHDLESLAEIAQLLLP